jgi:hypothetical protein
MTLLLLASAGLAAAMLAPDDAGDAGRPVAQGS